jgi:hypothetical protein
MRNHQIQCAEQDGIYEVDQIKFPAFLNHMHWTQPPRWNPCRPTKIGNQSSPTVPPPLPVPTGYQIPKRRSTLRSPVKPPSIPRLMEVHQEPPVPRTHRRYNPISRPPRALKERLAPLSERIPRRMQQFSSDLQDYEHTLTHEIATLRRDQLEHARRTHQYEQLGQEIARLNDAVHRLRRAQNILVVPRANQ